MRELLELDRTYFSGESDGLLIKTFSRLKRAGKQLLKRPTLLRDAIQKFDLRALYLPDRKRILIDDRIPKPKHRWLEAHEIGHDILPWHHEMMLGDDELTQTASVHDKMEAEANFAAGSLLFLGDRFIEECRSLPPSIESAQFLKKRYGNTFTTLWRMIKHAGEDLPNIGFICLHPKDFGEEAAFRHIIPSAASHQKFDASEPNSIEDEIESYCFRRRGPLGEGEVILNDREGNHHEFFFETFYNSYDALTLGIHVRRVPTIVPAASLLTNIR
ncbi:MAG: ImmA/IrrE family metallo-endopeptidase [Verrucomicrobiota bacterium]